jgi:uncharacterized protein (TIGR02118 family)
MAKFIALWGHPDDIPGFEKHYREVHIPLCHKWPGVESISGTATGDPAPYHLVFEATFESANALRDALKSPEMMAAGKDAVGIAKQYGARPTMLVGDDL